MGVFQLAYFCAATVADFCSSLDRTPRETDANRIDVVEQPLLCGVKCRERGRRAPPKQGKDRSMQSITTTGLDLAKSVFQIHGVGDDGTVSMRRKLRRAEALATFAKLSPCFVGMEACGGEHYWAREIGKLGHTVRLIPPAYVNSCVKRGKTDAADAEAINALRAHLSELGLVTKTGVGRVADLCAIVRDEADDRLQAPARFALKIPADQIDALSEAVEDREARIVADVRRDEAARRLTTTPGVEPISAAAIKAQVPGIAGFTSPDISLPGLA